MLRIYSSHSGKVEELPPQPAMRVYCDGDLRSCLVSDVLRRVLERHRVRVFAWWGGQVPFASSFNLLPPEESPLPQVDLTLSTVPAQLPADLSAVEPLAVRLAVLRHHYRRPLELNADELHQAERTLSEWRTAVASWAESPSAPMAAEPVARIQDALDDDLDTPAALAGMAALAADESVSPGSRFESFMHLDRTFALDLASRIGR